MPFFNHFYRLVVRTKWGARHALPLHKVCQHQNIRDQSPVQVVAQTSKEGHYDIINASTGFLWKLRMFGAKISSLLPHSLDGLWPT